MISVDKCPACGCSQFNVLHSCTDNTVSHESFPVITCITCGLGITTPRPDDVALPQYYLSEDYISHSGTSRGLTGQLYLLARKFTLNWKCKIVETNYTKGALLDFGCGTGEFLQVMKKRNWKIEGVEPSKTGRTKAEVTTGQDIHSTISEFGDQKVDAITLWHVLEHIPDLSNTLKILHGLLRKDGGIFIAVPNYLSQDSHYYKEHWAGYDVPRHLWHFSKESMELLLRQNGFKLKAIIPMKLDAYYVSLLSEKNKKASFIKQFTNAFIQGTKSNLKGGKNKNHSSLIYFASPL